MDDGARVIATDIAERKKAEEELKKSKKELEAKVGELERFGKLSVGRELKKRIKEMEGKQK